MSENVSLANVSSLKVGYKIFRLFITTVYLLFFYLCVCMVLVCVWGGGVCGSSRARTRVARACVCEVVLICK